MAHDVDLGYVYVALSKLDTIFYFMLCGSFVVQ